LDIKCGALSCSLSAASRILWYSDSRTQCSCFRTAQTLSLAILRAKSSRVPSCSSFHRARIPRQSTSVNDWIISQTADRCNSASRSRLLHPQHLLQVIRSLLNSCAQYGRVPHQATVRTTSTYVQKATTNGCLSWACGQSEATLQGCYGFPCCQPCRPTHGALTGLLRAAARTPCISAIISSTLIRIGGLCTVTDVKRQEGDSIKNQYCCTR
jgi:hypothetical protein